MKPKIDNDHRCRHMVEGQGECHLHGNVVVILSLKMILLSQCSR